MQRALANLGITPKVAARMQMQRPIDRMPDEPEKKIEKKPDLPKPFEQKTEPRLADLKPEPRPSIRPDMRTESAMEFGKEHPEYTLHSDLLDIKVTNSSGLKKVNSHKQLVVEPFSAKVPLAIVGFDSQILIIIIIRMSSKIEMPHLETLNKGVLQSR